MQLSFCPSQNLPHRFTNPNHISIINNFPPQAFPRHTNTTMSSSEEEEKFVQNVQDFMESGSPSSVSLPSSSRQSRESHITYQNLLGILGSVNDAEMAVLNKVLKYLKTTNFERKNTSLKNFLVMKLKKDGFNASLCKSKSSWITTSDCDYEYIDVTIMDEKKKKNKNESMRLIVDLDFNSQFEIARPTSTYTHFLEALPSIFVGSEEKLIKIISILCSAAKQSLKERGLHIPPWRQASYMQSKWIPEPAATADGAKDGEASTKGSGSPPMISPKRKEFGGRSALTSQLSNMRINCC